MKVLWALSLFGLLGCLPALAQTPGTTFKDCQDCPEMVIVPSGTFVMGAKPIPSINFMPAPDEMPQRTVTVGSFALAKYEVTQEFWTAVMGKTTATTRTALPIFRSKPSPGMKLRCLSRNSVPVPDSPTDCRQRRNGNTPHAPAVRLCFPSVTMSKSSAAMRGLVRTQADTFVRSDSSCRTRSGFMICTAMCENGSRTVISQPMTAPPQMAALSKGTVTASATIGAGRGLTVRSICGPIIATAWGPAAGASLSVSGSPEPYKSRHPQSDHESGLRVRMPTTQGYYFV